MNKTGLKIIRCKCIKTYNATAGLHGMFIRPYEHSLVSPDFPLLGTGSHKDKETAHAEKFFQKINYDSEEIRYLGN